MKILLLDNYDSFTYNLLHVVKELGIKDVEVFRNDQIALSEIERFDKLSAKLSVLHWKTLQMYIMVYKPRFISSKTIFCFRIWSTKYP